MGNSGKGDGSTLLATTWETHKFFDHDFFGLLHGHAPSVAYCRYIRY